MASKSILISFRLSEQIVEELIQSGKIPEDVERSHLSNLIKSEWLSNCTKVPQPIERDPVMRELRSLRQQVAELRYLVVESQSQNQPKADTHIQTELPLEV